MQTLARHVALLVCLGIVVPACGSGQTLPMAPVASPLPATFPVGGQTPTSLNGVWRFHPGDDPHFADPNYDDSGWALLRSDAPWTDQGYENLSGFAWYRFRVQLPAGSQPRSILLPKILSGYQCFVDGRLVHTEGALHGLSPARYSIPAVIDLPTGSGPYPQAVSVALRVWFDPTLDESAAGGPYGKSVQLASAGDSAVVHQNLLDLFALWRQKKTVTLATSLLFVLAGIVCFPLFFLEKSHKEYLWYGVAATCYGLDLWIEADWSTHAWPISAFSLLDSFLSMGTIAGLTLFLTYLLGFKRNYVIALVLAAEVAASSAGPLLDAGIVGGNLSNFVSAFGSCIFFAWGIFVVARRALQGELDARLLVVPVTLDFGFNFLESLRVEFPSIGDPIIALAGRLICSDPFPIRVRDFTAPCVLMAFVTVLLIRFARIRKQHERIMADLSAARSIQHLLIPKEIPAIPGLKIEAAYYPAQEVGGDFFQVIPVGSNKTLVVLGDVSGKGLPAAMTVSLIVGIVRTLAEFTSAPGAILAGLNTRLVGRGSGFTTCLALEIESDGSMTFANAGQLAPYRNGAEIVSEAALPLGILAEVVFPEVKVQLGAGDHLTLMTDGIPEAGSGHELFGFARTEGLSQQSAERIAAEAKLFGQTDDITVLSIEFGG